MRNSHNRVFTNTTPLNLYPMNILFNKAKSKSLEKTTNNLSQQNNFTCFLSNAKQKFPQYQKNILKQSRINLSNYKSNSKINNYINYTNTNSIKYFPTEPQNRIIKNSNLNPNFNTINNNNNNFKLNNFIKGKSNQNFHFKAPQKSFINYYTANNTISNLQKNRSRNRIKCDFNNNNYRGNDEIIRNFEEYKNLKKENSELRKRINDYQFKVNVLEKKILEIMNLYSENSDLNNDCDGSEFYNNDTINSMDINIDEV